LIESQALRFLIESTRLSAHASRPVDGSTSRAPIDSRPVYHRAAKLGQGR